jgi:hypothetical protein
MNDMKHSIFCEISKAPFCAYLDHRSLDSLIFSEEMLSLSIVPPCSVNLAVILDLCTFTCMQKLVTELRRSSRKGNRYVDLWVSFIFQSTK